MDLTVKLNETLLNIRTAILIETKNGYIFEKDLKNSYFFTTGGRIKTKESSIEAAKREVFEELGIEIHTLEISAIIENFFTENNTDFHEICFYYKTSYFENFVLPENFFIIKPEEFSKYDIRPIIIGDIVKSYKTLMHKINRS